MSAVVQVLSEEDADRVNAAVKGVEVFVDTLMLVTGTQNELSKGSGAGEAPAANLDSPAEPMNVDGAPPAQVCRGFVDTCMNIYQCHGPVHHLSHLNACIWRKFTSVRKMWSELVKRVDVSC